MKKLQNLAACSLLILTLTGCKTHDIKKKDSVAEVIIEKKQTALANKRNDLVIEYLEELVARHQNHPDNQQHKLELAQMYLETEQFEPAFDLYNNYVLLYPNDEKVEHAQYHAILAAFYQTLKISKQCDSSDAQRTRDLCKAYLDGEQSTYRDDVRNIYRTCESRLIDKEIYVFNTNLRYKKYQSAQKCLEDLKTKYLVQHPDLEPQMMYLDCKLAHYTQQTDHKSSVVGELLEKFPDSVYTQMAEGLTAPEGNFLRRLLS